MNAVVESSRGSAAGEKLSEIFDGKIALTIDGSAPSAARRKMSAVGRGKISIFSSAVGARFPKRPNQSSEPTRTAGVAIPNMPSPLDRTVSLERKTACADVRAAHL